MTKTKKCNICIITQPIMSKAGLIPLSNLIDVINAFSKKTYIITGNYGMNLVKSDENNTDLKTHFIEVKYILNPNIVLRIVNYIYVQLMISYKLVQNRKNVEILVYFLDAHALLLPVITAKLLKKKIVFALAASLTKSAKANNDTLAKISIYSEFINYRLSDCIILHSQNLIKEWNLEKYEDKIQIAHEYFLDFEKFKVIKPFDERNNLIGYAGRLSGEKGVINFVKAIPEILPENDNFKFVICGDGPLRNVIENYIKEKAFQDRTELLGWISHEQLPNYLNELKLLVIPSYTESGPIIALESIACGTPILATNVGHILNMITDGTNGFILENNSPRCITENIERICSLSDFDQIIKNAEELVNKEFTYEKAVESYKRIMTSL